MHHFTFLVCYNRGIESILATRQFFLSHKIWNFTDLSIEYNLSKITVTFALFYARVTLSRSWLAMDTRFWKFAISGLIKNKSSLLWVHRTPSREFRLSFSGFGSNFGSVNIIFGMLKTAEGPREVLYSCIFRVSILSAVWPSWVQREDVLWVRVAIVITSYGHRRHRAFSSHDCNTMGTWSMPVVFIRLNDVARP